LVVGIEQPDGGYWMPMFVALEEGVELDDDLKADILGKIRAATSPRHVPDEVHQVTAIPRTLTGKKLEVPVKRILMGADPDKVLNRNAVADPDALDTLVSVAQARAVSRRP
jgi:acetoacetyl-CoA synthetase